MLEENDQISKSVKKFLENLCRELNVKISKNCRKKFFSFCLDKFYEISYKSGEICEEKSKNVLSDEIFFFVLIKMNLVRYIIEANEEKKRFEKENLNFGQILT
jgi:hypothetical protein